MDLNKYTFNIDTPWNDLESRKTRSPIFFTHFAIPAATMGSMAALTFQSVIAFVKHRKLPRKK